MWNMNEVQEIKYKTDYVFYILFDDGTKGDVDFSEYISKGPVFEPLRDLEQFSRANRLRRCLKSIFTSNTYFSIEQSLVIVSSAVTHF